MAIAKQKGANVIAMDMNEERLEFAKEWANVDHTIQAADAPLQRLQELTNGDLPTIVFDATGNQHSMMNVFHYPAHGGKLIYVGLVKANITFPSPLFHSKELTLFASRNATKEDFNYVIELLKDKKIDATRFITHRANFDHVINDFEKWLQPETDVVKAMIER